MAWSDTAVKGNTGCCPAGCCALPARGCFRSVFMLDQFLSLILGGIPHAEGWEVLPYCYTTIQAHKQILQRGVQGGWAASSLPPTPYSAKYKRGSAGSHNHVNSHRHRVFYIHVSAIVITCSMGNHVSPQTKAKSVPYAHKKKGYKHSTALGTNCTSLPHPGPPKQQQCTGTRATMASTHSEVTDYLSSSLLQLDLHSPFIFICLLNCIFFYYQVFNGYFYTSHA